MLIKKSKITLSILKIIRLSSYCVLSSIVTFYLFSNALVAWNFPSPYLFHLQVIICVIYV